MGIICKYLSISNYNWASILPTKLGFAFRFIFPDSATISNALIPRPTILTRIGVFLTSSRICCFWNGQKLCVKTAHSVARVPAPETSGPGCENLHGSHCSVNTPNGSQDGCQVLTNLGPRWQSLRTRSHGVRIGRSALLPMTTAPLKVRIIRRDPSSLAPSKLSISNVLRAVYSALTIATVIYPLSTCGNLFRMYIIL